MKLSRIKVTYKILSILFKKRKEKRRIKKKLMNLKKKFRKSRKFKKFCRIKWRKLKMGHRIWQSLALWTIHRAIITRETV